MTENDTEEIGCDGLGMAKENLDARVTNNSQPDGVVGLVCQSSASPTQSCSQNFPKRNLRSAHWDHVSKSTPSNRSSSDENTRKPPKNEVPRTLHGRYDQHFDCQLTLEKKVMVCCFMS